VIGDLNLYGIFVPTLLVLMLVAYGVFLLLHRVLNTLHFYRLVWHRSLFNVALYIVLLGLIEHLTRYLMTS
jgi:Na+/phosphate symporter